jgi:hypothetical protein
MKATINSPIILKDIWGSEIDQVRKSSVDVVVSGSKLTGYDWIIAVKERYKEENNKREKARKESEKIGT